MLFTGHFEATYYALSYILYGQNIIIPGNPIIAMLHKGFTPKLSPVTSQVTDL